MLYRREATTPSILGPSFIEVDVSANPEAHVKDLTNCIINIQATTYSTAYKVKTLELSPSNASRALLPGYQNFTGGRAYKLESLWVGPCEVIFKKSIEYTLKLLSSGCPFARVHSKFLHIYQLTVLNLEGGDVGNYTINAILIRPLKSDICKDLVGFAFDFRNSLPSVNESVPMSTHPRLPYQPSTNPGMTSPQHDPLFHSVYLMSDHQSLSTN
ncbi:hypothetical protein DSO57_1008033 [Entomophthora muscae]|uniref:Uncharacterized protein n=1 Tax=Entomophthora muscae TaxID=34485 RepID=A0ACC2US69_9FUNG|nr:hypothetical protein DSO57_1008033 [Entomophthora muscae]